VELASLTSLALPEAGVGRHTRQIARRLARDPAIALWRHDRTRSSRFSLPGLETPSKMQS